MTRSIHVGIGFLISIVSLAALAAAEPTTDQTGPLHIEVTAVEGGAQYRADSQSKWTAVTVGLQPNEGVEFRTGPRGSIQFTIGDDDVYRVDRLSVVKVLRANLGPDGTIRTDVGMTYGRVSKDIDAPSRPHADTIVTPVSTLAVRGTHVAMYDQPPFAPEAISLTGLAVYKNPSGRHVSLGSAGGGLATVSGNALGAAGYSLTNNLVNPLGNFSGQTGPELVTQLNQPGQVPPTSGPQQSNPAKTTSSVVGGQTNMSTITQPGFTGIAFGLSWVGPVGNTIVDLTVSGPGVHVTSVDPPMNSETGSVFYGGSRVADASGSGSEAFIIVNNGATSVGTGQFTITETLVGTTGNLSPGQAGTVNTTLIGETATSSATGSAGLTVPQPDQLSSDKTSATYTITTPFGQGAHFTPSGNNISIDVKKVRR